MIEFYIDTRVDLKTVFPHGPLTLSALTLQGIKGMLVRYKRRLLRHWQKAAVLVDVMVDAELT
jgi:hypothetical protein